jgi:prepilin-type N-terminal cleavage/methylation domain-containing protein
MIKIRIFPRCSSDPLLEPEASMTHHPRQPGYTLIELLVVLFIIGVLALASVWMIENRPASAVHGLLDNVEGVLTAAQKGTTSTLGDISLTAKGSWSTTDIATLTFTGASGSSETFTYNSTSRDQQYAAIDCGTGWADLAVTSLAAAFNQQKSGITDPNFVTNFQAALDPSANLFKTGTATINGYSKRANSGFYIAVVGIRNGVPVSGGPVGVLVVPAGSGTIYKYFRTSSADPWRRL